jgi:hypothetical protein
MRRTKDVRRAGFRGQKRTFHQSFRPPWGHPQYPARDGGAERLVLSPERLLERGFFVRHDEDVEEEPEQRAGDDEAPIAHQHCLTQDDGNE